MKTKIVSHGDEVTDFYDEEIPKLDSKYTCLTVITMDSALKKGKNYYSQFFLKYCKCIKKKFIKHNFEWKMFFLKMYFLREQFWKR